MSPFQRSLAEAGVGIVGAIVLIAVLELLHVPSWLGLPICLALVVGGAYLESRPSTETPASKEEIKRIRRVEAKDWLEQLDPPITDDDEYRTAVGKLTRGLLEGRKTVRIMRDGEPFTFTITYK